MADMEMGAQVLAPGKKESHKVYFHNVTSEQTPDRKLK